MIRKSFREWLQGKAVRIGSVLLAVAVLVGGGFWIYDYQHHQDVPELVTYVDTEGEVTIDSDEVPLAAAPEVKTKTTQSTKRKKVRMKTRAKKTYTKKKKPKSTTKTRMTDSTDKTVTVKTVSLVNTTERYKKGSKVKTVLTTTKKVVTTTTVKKSSNSTQTAGIQQNSPNISTSAGTSTSGTSSTVVNGEIAIAKAAPRVDGRVSHAFTTLGFKIYLNSGVSYSGLCDTKTRSITLRAANDTAYHELGHFLAFIAGNADKSSEFQAIYNEEKGKYTAINKAYATQNSAEYFAESFKEYTLDLSALQKNRPKTYNAIVNALSKVTDQQIAKVQAVYGPIWK